MFVDVLAITLETVQHEQSASGKKVQHAKSGTEEECKSKILNVFNAT